MGDQGGVAVLPGTGAEDLVESFGAVGVGAHGPPGEMYHISEGEGPV